MVTYGHEVVSEDDRLVYLVERTGAMILEYGAAGSAVVDFIPIRELLNASSKRNYSLARTDWKTQSQSAIFLHGSREPDSSDTLRRHTRS